MPRGARAARADQGAMRWSALALACGDFPRRHRGRCFGFCSHELSPATAVARRIEAALRRLQTAVVAALLAFGVCFGPVEIAALLLPQAW